MSAKSILLWSVSGFLVMTALAMMAPQEAPALTLERGLGPEVHTSQL